LSSLRVKKTSGKSEVSDQIGRQLRSVYNDILAQPVPDRFLDLLKDLDAIPGLPGSEAAGQKKVVKQ
jgi:Anti-sigma factor NepR